MNRKQRKMSILAMSWFHEQNLKTVEDLERVRAIHTLSYEDLCKSFTGSYNWIQKNSTHNRRRKFKDHQKLIERVEFIHPLWNALWEDRWQRTLTETVLNRANNNPTLLKIQAIN